MTLTTFPEARPMPRSRPKPTNVSERVRALVIWTNAKPSIKSLTQARQEIAQIAWDVRTSGDWDTWRDVMRHLGSLREQQQREGRKLDAAGRAQRLEVKNSPPAQLVRLAEQQVRAERRRLPKSEAQQQEYDRNLIRWRAEAVCEALWSLNDGDRTWEAVSTRSTLLPTHSSDVEMTGSSNGPQRLTIRVPELSVLRIEEHILRLYRAEYDALMEAWGYTSMRKVEILRERIVATTSQSISAADELTRLVMHAYISRPALALAWSNYLTSSRMASIFEFHSQRQRVHFAPRRSEDLRDCALELVNLVEVVARLRSEQL
ncbi:hypothetical protein [Deinococcus sp. UYEF24]